MRSLLATAALALLSVDFGYAQKAPRSQEDILQARAAAKHLRFDEVISKRQSNGRSPDITVPRYYRPGEFKEGQPIAVNGNGGPLSGGTNHVVDLQSPSNLGQEPTDAGNVANLKWRFSDSKTRLLKGGWVRQQLITDLPQSKDISGAQQHLKKGAVRELHWHKVAEWGYVYAGSVSVGAVDEEGRSQWETLNVGDIWYFPKGLAHTVQGLEEDNEFLLVFDEGDFEAPGTTFNIADWLSHTPVDIVARNFGVNASAISGIPKSGPYIAAGQVSKSPVPVGPAGKAEGPNSYVIHSSQVKPIVAAGGGGSIQIFDSRNFPISKTIAASVVTIKPGGLRELHWHPTAEEWLFFVQGQGRASIFTGNQRARTFDFSAGDTAVFPDNSGHYVENTSETEDLVWIEIFKADRIADISLNQWLALTPADVVSQVLNISEDAVKGLKKEKQLILA